MRSLRICLASTAMFANLAAASAQEPCVSAECAEPACRNGGWRAGADALFIAPRFESNPAYFVNRQTAMRGAPVPTNSQTVEEFRYGLSSSPRLWLGYSSECGLGGRLRWFHFDQAANPKEIVNPVVPLGSATVYQSVSSASPLLAIASQTTLPAVNSIQVQGQGFADDRLSLTSGLQIDMVDADATFNDLHTGSWDFELFGGVRLARIEQTYSAVLQGPVPQTISSRQLFEGAGPSLGIEGHRKLGFGGLGIYGSGRVSFLFGADEHTSQGLNIGLVPNFALATHDDRSSRDRVLPLIDIEFGVEGSQPLGRADVFARGGVFSQLIPLGSGANGNGNAGLIGLSLGAGVRY